VLAAAHPAAAAAHPAAAAAAAVFRLMHQACHQQHLQAGGRWPLRAADGHDTCFLLLLPLPLLLLLLLLLVCLSGASIAM
jgi:hypothetical protein